MVISVSNSYSHKAPCAKSVNNQSDLEQNVMSSLEKLGISTENIQRNENGHIELPANADRLKLHSLMLQCENLGLDLKITKKTLLEIS